MWMGPGTHRREPWWKPYLRRSQAKHRAKVQQRRGAGTLLVSATSGIALLLSLLGSSSYLTTEDPDVIYPVTVAPAPSPDVPTSVKPGKGGSSESVVLKRTPSRRATPTATPRNVRTKPAPKRKQTAGPVVVPEPSVSPTPIETDTPNDPPVVEQTKRWHCNWDAGGSD